jgi:hypothetical protein
MNKKLNGIWTLIMVAGFFSRALNAQVATNEDRPDYKNSFAFTTFFGGGIAGNDIRMVNSGCAAATIKAYGINVRGCIFGGRARYHNIQAQDPYPFTNLACGGITLGYGFYRKYFSADIGAGAGKFSYRYVSYEKYSPSGAYTTEISGTKKCFSMSSKISVHSRNVGLSLMGTVNMAKGMYQGAMVVGVEFGLFHAGD